MLYRATVAYAAGAPYEYCKRYATPSCTSCPRNPGTSTTACSVTLNGWKWGVCMSTMFSSDTCSHRGVTCVYEILCKSNRSTGVPCAGGGQFEQCMP
jgi:hypothetical protein